MSHITSVKSNLVLMNNWLHEMLLNNSNKILKNKKNVLFIVKYICIPVIFQVGTYILMRLLIIYIYMWVCVLKKKELKYKIAE